MRESTKAALFSGLLLPGLGQMLYLRNYLLGAVLAMLALASFAVMVTTIASIIGDILAGIEAGVIGLDVVSLDYEVRTRVLEAGSVYTWSKYIFGLTWITAIVHAIMAGRKRETEDEQAH